VASDQTSSPSPAVQALERLGSLSLRKVSMEELLQTVADLAKMVMPGNPEASVSWLGKDHPTTVASTGQLATDLDETQYDRGHSPCLHAARTGELTEIADTRTDSRRPDYMPRAAEHGALSSLSVPLAIDDEQVPGALNIYARRRHAFDEASRSAATRFGPYAAVAAGNLHAYQSARDRADHLQAALETRGASTRPRASSWTEPPRQVRRLQSLRRMEYEGRLATDPARRPPDAPSPGAQRSAIAPIRHHPGTP
jgi:GAF domain-containing protein